MKIYSMHAYTYTYTYTHISRRLIITLIYKWVSKLFIYIKNKILIKKDRVYKKYLNKHKLNLLIYMCLYNYN